MTDDKLLALQLHETLRAAIAAHSADFGNIQLFDESSGALRIAASQGFDAQFLDYFRVVEGTSTICGRAAQLGGGCIVHDVQLDAAFAPHREIAAHSGFRACRSETLLATDGRNVGVLSVHFRAPDVQHTADDRFTSTLTRAASYIERARPEHRRYALDLAVAGSLEPEADLIFAFRAECLRAQSTPRLSGLMTEPRPQLSQELRLAIRRFVVSLRAEGGPPEAMVKRFKGALAMAAIAPDRESERALASAVLSAAIGDYYAVEQVERDR